MPIEMIRPHESEISEDVWQMICAAVSGDVPQIKALLQRDPALAHTEYWYTQPLHYAVREGHLAAVQVLLDAGADPTVVRYGGEELATVARDRGHEAMAALIEAARTKFLDGAPVSHEIHTAARDGNLSRVRALVTTDPALVNLRDAEGSTPLHHAVTGGRLDLIGYLLDQGADIHATSGTGGTYHPSGASPIDLALWTNAFLTQRNDWMVAGFLLARGAHYSMAIAAAAGDSARVRQLLEADPAQVNAAQPGGRRPLSAAIERGHDDIANLLLEHGADPNLPEGRYAPRGTALHVAARAGNHPMVKLLLQHGADPAGYIDSAGSVWEVADRDMRLLLYQHGLKTVDFDLENYDALALQAENDPERLARAGCGSVFTMIVKNEWFKPEQFTDEKKEALLRLLLDRGVRVPPMVTGCRTYLWHKPKFARILLEHGMDPNLPNWQRVTPLHNVCSADGRGNADENRLELAALFLEFGAAINAKDEEYRSTPLAWAARCGLSDMVEFLLAHSAATNLPDDLPWATPLAWARRRGHEAIVARLKDSGAQC